MTDQTLNWPLLARAIRVGTRLLMYALFLLLALRFLFEVMNRLRYAIYERRWPTVDVPFLVVLWAAIAVAFHFALPCGMKGMPRRWWCSLGPRWWLRLSGRCVGRNPACY
jgi:hypothetical protein